MNWKCSYATMEKIGQGAYLIKFASTHPTDELFHQYLVMLLNVLKGHRGKKMYLLVDSTQSAYLSDKLCQVQAEWLSLHQKIISQKIGLTIYVLPSAVQRLNLYKVSNIQRLPAPFKIVKNLNDGLELIDGTDREANGQPMLTRV